MAILGAHRAEGRGPLARLCAVATGLAAAMLFAASAHAQTAALEYAVKANFLYKFGPFVTWPAQAFASEQAPFNVCVLGEDPFGATLDQAVRGQSVSGHPVVVRRIWFVSRSSACHVLYIGRSAQQPRAEVLDLLAGTPVLTVTDERLGGARGMVHFVVRDGRVRFGIDARRAQISGLSISSKLLGLAVPLGQGGS